MFEKSFGPKQLAIKYTEIPQISNKQHQMFEMSFGPKQLAIKYTELFQISNKYHQILEMSFGPQTISNQIYRASSNIKQIASNV